MKFFVVTLGAFLLCMFVINLKDYLKSPKYNRWISGKVDNVELAGEDEIWTIKWTVPHSLRKKNSEGEQLYYFKFKHYKNFNNIDERRNYLNDKIFKKIENKFYLSINVDHSGVIRGVGRYDGYMSKTIGYGISVLIFIGLLVWLY